MVAGAGVAAPSSAGRSPWSGPAAALLAVQALQACWLEQRLAQYSWALCPTCLLPAASLWSPARSSSEALKSASRPKTRRCHHRRPESPGFRSSRLQGPLESFFVSLWIRMSSHFPRSKHLSFFGWAVSAFGSVSPLAACGRISLWTDTASVVVVSKGAGVVRHCRTTPTLACSRFDRSPSGVCVREL